MAILTALPERQPKRVVLRLRVKDFEGNSSSEHDDAIMAYLVFAGRSSNELEKTKFFAHIEPFQDPELRQTSFHIVLDMEKDLVEDTDLQSLPHEIYRVRRDQHGILWELIITT